MRHTKRLAYARPSEYQMSLNHDDDWPVIVALTVELVSADTRCSLDRGGAKKAQPD